MIKAIVFDIGGVLIGLDMDRCIRAFRELLGFERITELLDPCHQKGIIGDLEGGKLSPEHFRELVLAESRPGTLPEDVDRALGQMLKPRMDPRTVEVVRALGTRYPLYLLSNNNPISMKVCNRILKENGLDPERTFKEAFVSSDLKLLKPSAEFYLTVVRRIGLPARDILFIDDSQANVDGARAVGLEARLYVPGTDLGVLLSDC